MTKKGYALLDLASKEARFVWLEEAVWDEAFTELELHRYLEWCEVGEADHVSVGTE